MIEVRCYFLYFLAEALSFCQPRESAGQTYRDDDDDDEDDDNVDVDDDDDDDDYD